ncbi:MAG: hypothetical protein IJT49_04845 [Clostridia bacterium]|nr:hypothetical protein [Clostridia bacterium]
MKNTVQKIICLFTVLIFIVSCLPISALAADGYSLSSDELTVSPPTGDAKITLAVILIVASIIAVVVIFVIIRKRNVK